MRTLPERTASHFPTTSHPDYPGQGDTDLVIECCGVKQVIADGLRALRTGGTYVLVGLVHPDSALGVTAEQLIRKCLTVIGTRACLLWGRGLKGGTDWAQTPISRCPQLSQTGSDSGRGVYEVGSSRTRGVVALRLARSYHGDA